MSFQRKAKWIVFGPTVFSFTSCQLFFLPFPAPNFLVALDPLSESPPAVATELAFELLASNGICFCHFSGLRRYIGQGGMEICETKTRLGKGFVK